MTINIVYADKIKTVEGVVMIIDDEAQNARRVVLEHNYMLVPLNHTIVVLSEKVDEMEKHNFKGTCFKTEKMFDVEKMRDKEPELFDDLCKDYPTEEKNILICVSENA